MNTKRLYARFVFTVFRRRRQPFLCAGYVNLFKVRPLEPIFGLHKLRGNFADDRAFRLCDGDRVLFSFQNDHYFLLINIGSHDD